MMRIFIKGSKWKLEEKMLKELEKIPAVASGEQYLAIHSDFCYWGMKNITLTKRNGGLNASYGQIAKTLDVAMKIIVYYCHYPDCARSEQISRWLNAAIDTKMMECLKATYPDAIASWPTTLKQVDDAAYATIQALVRRFIREQRDGDIIPVQFDDIYWEVLNR
jgi:hypothetical protein